MLLSDKFILQNLKKGNIIIDPYDPKNLGSASYDVTLGEYFYREQMPDPGYAIYSPWGEAEVNRIWGKPQKATNAFKYFCDHGVKLPIGISKKDLVILIPPGETFLCHTREYIGGRNGVTTMMKARSSWGRNFIEVCKCAGWGDVGYINRWTMEITNNSQHYIIPLVVGRRIAQIAFFDVGETEKEYTKTGKYQTEIDLKNLKRDWKPSNMLPRMWMDREVKK
ncbi:MAG: hypothetical protein HY044_04735 [Candidatus Woesebacteria bacterium]|nr:MAG: hypothetical protein HY044_04735 [Candidatus Woesebacteria bacterium]